MNPKEEDFWSQEEDGMVSKKVEIEG